MSSQPSDHGSWRLQDNNNGQNINVASFHANMNSNPNPSPMFPRPPSASGSGSNHPPAPTSRKRQFRFSVRADIELLNLVISLNPYGAPHGGRLHKWQAIADTLRESGIDIDFRRARDRTGLLLDQWREKDLSLLRRSGSGNHEDQVQKEQLLERISEIEHAARPRDNASDWRSREQAGLQNEPVSSPRQLNPPHDNPPGPQAALNVMAAQGDRRTTKFGNFPAGPHGQGQLPPIVQKHDTHAMSQARAEAELQTMQYGSHQGPPEKQFKNNQGQALSPRFTQPLFGNAPSPAKVLPLHPPSVDRRTPPRSDLSPYRNNLPLLRQPGQPDHRPGNPHVLSSTALDVSPVHAVTSSPRIGEGQNTQLDPLQTSLPRQPAESDAEHLRGRITRLERQLDNLSELSKKRLEMEERRLQWEQDRESKRLQLEQERVAKEFEDRQAEREDRRVKEQVDKEERKRLFDLIVRSQRQSPSEAENAEQ